MVTIEEENGTSDAPLDREWKAQPDQRTDDWEDITVQLTGLHHGSVIRKQTAEQMKHYSKLRSAIQKQLL